MRDRSLPVMRGLDSLVACCYAPTMRLLPGPQRRIFPPTPHEEGPYGEKIAGRTFATRCYRTSLVPISFDEFTRPVFLRRRRCWLRAVAASRCVARRSVEKPALTPLSMDFFASFKRRQFTLEPITFLAVETARIGGSRSAACATDLRAR